MMDSGNHPPFWCELCKQDLQSEVCFAQHLLGKKHVKFARAAGESISLPHMKIFNPELKESSFRRDLLSGRYKNIVVLTGAGISTAAGIPDFRTPETGLFAILKRSRFAKRYPELEADPADFFSRNFVERLGEADRKEWENVLMNAILAGSESEEVERSEEAESELEEVERSEEVERFFSHDKLKRATLAHSFISWLHQKGWLRRVYTQNIDGLHSASSNSKSLPSHLVAEVHGFLSDPKTLVLYGDPVRKVMFDFLREDFGVSQPNPPVDLVLVMGTSLQVAPFCAIPNLAPTGCARVLVNCPTSACLTNAWGGTDNSKSKISMAARVELFGSGGGLETCSTGSSAIKLAGRKVTLKPRWKDKKWRQLLLDETCDDFVNKSFREYNNGYVKVSE